ncbi:MAG: tRNA 4-thiouridine(8) synthase ThiI [archaeon]
MVKALVLLSGGLDSRLAVKIMQKFMTMEAIFFKLPFGSRYSKCFDDVVRFCRKEKVKLNIIDCTTGKLLDEYLNIVRKPKHGRGTELNPCIDCKIFILRKAKEFADANGFKVIATGEVLGQRPMSQNRRALDLIEKESGLKGRLLRPLSAKLLPPIKGISKSKFLDIRGRSREKQIALAKKFKISFPSPAGGCLLCEKGFCRKLQPLLKRNISEIDIGLLKIGRHFKNSGIVLGKNYEQNLQLSKVFKKYRTGILLEPKEPGPTAFVRDKKYIPEAKKLIQKYSKHKIRTITTTD